ncbi:ABC transporter ATP-binding protein [Enterococcus italicus]|uniref:ABC transporter ATP-binding protein n=1 Tax=Enterococcus italicus TaxID=246144 RepID=UPI0020741F37|nr:ABC transporter ATP-binding protein [Enterococcus italicus]
MFSLLKYAKEYRKQLILGPVFKFLEAVFELILPFQMARLIDEGIKQNDWPRVVQMTVWMVAMSVIGLACALVCQYFASFASQGFGTELRNQLLRKINQLSHEELNQFGTDTLITRMTNDVNQLQLALAMLIRLVVRAPFLSVGAILMAFVIDWQAGLLFLLVLPLFCLVLYWMITRSVPMYKKVQQRLDALNELVSQNLSGVRVIRAFARTDQQKQTFHEATDALNDTYVRVGNLQALLTPATTLLMNVGIIGLFYLGGWKVNAGHLQQGQLLALVNYMNQMLLALIVVSNLVVIFTRAAASAERINEVLAVQPAIVDCGAAPTETLKGGLAFEKVSFRYGPTYGLALSDISFTVKPNQTIGLIGPTGSGKSTLTQLIPRFYEASAGRILLDQRPVADFSLTTLRTQIAMVPQTAVLFHGTIRENLQWGKATASDDDCWQALAIAQATDFVQSLPKQLDTLIQEGGKNFSGGQRQRLTIARAVIAKPAILILDDSLSALDYKTDLALRRALQTQPGTVLIISQRVRSIQEADQILVMDNGRLLAQGTHEELLDASSEYREIVQSQAEVTD